MHARIFVIAAVTAATLGLAKAEQAADDHLGTVHFPISCRAVQAKFDRAVALLHNFFGQGVSGRDPGRSRVRHHLLGSGDERIAQPAGAALPAR